VILGQLTSRPKTGQAPSIAVTSGKHDPTSSESTVN
jgi:hypothetical protein